MTYDRNPSAELNELRQAALAYLAERHVMAPPPAGPPDPRRRTRWEHAH